MFKGRCTKILLLAVLPIALQATALSWGNKGHEAVVAVALQFDPTLRARINKVMKSLPKSPEWKALKATGLITPNPFQTEKENPTKWVKDLATDPEKSATFPDWARDYNGYKGKEYDAIHFYDLDFDTADQRWVKNPNALTALPDFELTLQNMTGGKQAWALAWILHIVGDLHQPLHTTTRALPDHPNKSDNGGNGAKYGSQKLHSWWDHLPDTAVGDDPDAYAQHLYNELKQRPQQEQDDFNQQAQNLNPIDWTHEGWTEITTIGYPSDHKVGNYRKEALKIVHRRILLGGARLANLLNKYLPPQ